MTGFNSQSGDALQKHPCFNSSLQKNAVLIHHLPKSFVLIIHHLQKSSVLITHHLQKSAVLIDHLQKEAVLVIYHLQQIDCLEKFFRNLCH